MKKERAQGTIPTLSVIKPSLFKKELDRKLIEKRFDQKRRC
jgi:hypothetical protein